MPRLDPNFDEIEKDSRDCSGMNVQKSPMLNHNGAKRASQMSETRTPTLTRKRRPPLSVGLGKPILAQFGDGKWHRLETIAAATGAPANHVQSILDRMRKWGTYKSKCDRKKVGRNTTSAYRQETSRSAFTS